MPRRPRIVIAGGGIGGLTAAIAMSRRDIEVTVCERAPAIMEVGAGVTLSPNALKAYAGLGLTKAIEEIGFESDYQVHRRWDTGEELSRVNRKGYAREYGAPYFSLHRADLVETLAAHLPEGAVRLNAHCVGAETAGNTAVARLADGTEIEADLVVGADGIHSAVRRSLFGDEAPRFTGTVCWRGLVPYKLFSPDVLSPDWHMYVGPGKHLIYYMVSRGELVNFVAHVEADGWTGESWTQECDRSELLDAFAGWHEPLQRLLGAAEHCYKWALFDRDPLPSWSKGHVTLLGDAAHAMPPFIGQGAGMAIEDGYALAAAVDHSPGDIPAALKLYETVRVARASGMVRKARAERDGLHMKTSWGERPVDANDKTGMNHHAIYTYDVRRAAAFSGQDAE